jgi:hypothetical protein
MKNLRISISGAVGSGKTTLTKELAAYFKIDTIDENFADIHKARQNFILAQKSKASAEEQKKAFKAWMDAYFSWIKSREFEYLSKKNFVADRSEADLVAFWLRDFSKSKVDGNTLKLLNLFKLNSQKITHSFILPLLKDVPNKNEAGLERTKNLCVKIGGCAMIHGLISQFTITPVMFIPPKVSTVADKIAFIEKFIETH